MGDDRHAARRRLDHRRTTAITSSASSSAVSPVVPQGMIPCTPPSISELDVVGAGRRGRRRRARRTASAGRGGRRGRRRARRRRYALRSSLLPMEERALFAFLVALALTAAVTPLVARLARRVGARRSGAGARARPGADAAARRAGDPRRRARRGRAVPARHARRCAASSAPRRSSPRSASLDDVRDLSPGVKLLGQVGGRADLRALGRARRRLHVPVPRPRRPRRARRPADAARARGGDERRQLLRRRRRARRRRLRDLRDRLRGDRLRPAARTPRACSPRCTAGAALGFLVHNFHPASVFMGDSGSNLLGLLLGA